MTLKVDTITNLAGTGAPNIPDGVSIAGTALASTSTMQYAASGSEPSSPENGELWFDTSSNEFKMYVNGAWYTVTVTAPPAWYGTRSLVGGGFQVTNQIQYFANASNTNAQDFGDLLTSRYGLAAASNGTRGLFAGGGTPYINVIEYVTIANTGNSVDFGDLTRVRFYFTGCGNGTYGFFLGGVNASNGIDYVTVSTAANAGDWGDLISGPGYNGQWSAANESRLLIGHDSTESNRIQYVSSTTPGNATNFGDMLNNFYFAAAVNDTTRAVYGGSQDPLINTMEYVTIATTGNATDFGDLTSAKGRCAVSASSTRGFWCGGGGSGLNTIDVATIQTPGNATDFGDLTGTITYAAGTAGS